MKLNISFSQLIAEFFIVFVGVAIALAADDWRGDREERDRELAYLLAIDTDMKSASDVLETALSDNNEFARDSSAALALFVGYLCVLSMMFISSQDGGGHRDVLLIDFVKPSKSN